MQQIAKKDNLTPLQAEDLLQWAMREMNNVFLLALQSDFKISRGNRIFTPDLKTAPLTGYCGLAQGFMGLLLKDVGVRSKRVALQTSPYPFSHVTLVAVLETTAGKKSYLIDPTFRQFCTGVDGEPGQVLGSMPDGEYISNRLLQEGFIELTPARADCYLAAFNKGLPVFADKSQAMSFFNDPPSSKMNKDFPRARLERDGFVPKSKPPVF